MLYSVLRMLSRTQLIGHNGSICTMTQHHEMYQKQKNDSDCGAYVIKFWEIVSTWSVIKKRMNHDDVGEDDINKIRSKLS